MKTSLYYLLATALLNLAGCLFDTSDSDQEGKATIKIVNGESGCTLNKVFITPIGENRGANQAGQGIRFNGTPGTYEVEAGETYSLSISSNTSTSNLSPEANCSVTLKGGETRIITYSYEGGPSLFWGTLSGCN
jgi:hypothetical protein